MTSVAIATPVHTAPRSSLSEAYAACAAIVAASGSSFARAFRLLPVERRQGLEALYAFCRLVDDAVDAGAGTGADARAVLATWRRELVLVFGGVPTHPVGMALADTVRRFGMARQPLDDIVTGVQMDLERRRYETFAELRRYCHHVAASVGLATLPILGCRSGESERYAVSLGVALQLTNILRDLAEDAERGRIYLPLEDLRRFGYRERDLMTHVVEGEFRRLMAFECERAAEFYRAARRELVARDRRVLAPAEGMRLVYERLLARIRRHPEAVFGPRLAVSRAEKVGCVAVAWARGLLGGRR